MDERKFKVDKYSRAREGFSKFLEIICSKCQNKIALYQKDGSGNLFRLYLDRIFEPTELRESLAHMKSKKDLSGLKCGKCDNLIGVPMVYEKEDRLAFNLVKGSYYKKNVSKKK